MRAAPGQAESKVPQLSLTTDLFFSHGTRLETGRSAPGETTEGMIYENPSASH